MFEGKQNLLNMSPRSLKKPIFIWIASLILFWVFITGLTLTYGRELRRDGKTVTLAKTSAVEVRGKERRMTDPDRLTEEEGSCLLSVARQTIEQKLFNQKDQAASVSASSPKFSKRRGTFVTLTIDGGLRGCIGHIIPQESLIEGIRVNAINAAFRDPRFKPLSKKEWEKVEIEISILTEPGPLEYADSADFLRKLRPGIDGVIIKKGHNQATFLPQVWEQLPDKKEFLTHLCLKAGLVGNEWKKEKLEIQIYQVQAFEE